MKREAAFLDVNLCLQLLIHRFWVIKHHKIFMIILLLAQNGIQCDFMFFCCRLLPLALNAYGKLPGTVSSNV